MFESGSFLLFHTVSKSPHLLNVALPLGVKYSLLPKETPHSVDGRESKSEAFQGTAGPLPGQSQPDMEPARLISPPLRERGIMHLFPSQTAPWPGRNGQVLTQFWPSFVP